MIKSFQQFIPKIAPDVHVDETAIVLGNVTLEQDCSIWPYAVLRGDINHIHIGKRSNIQDGCIVHVTHAGQFNPTGYHTHIGEEVIVGHRVILHGCTIEDNCLIGMGAIVMDGALIQSNVILGAGSLVTPNQILETGHLWLGSPARKIRKITAEEHDFIRYSANYYVQLKNQYSV